MRWQNLLCRAESELSAGPFPYRDFTTGGYWMATQLYRRMPIKLPPSQPDYRRAGVIKYVCSLLVAGLTMALSAKLGVVSLLLGGLGFYLAEVHFLFLFPLLAEDRKIPYRASVKITYELGLLHCVANIIPIALTMLFGLRDRKDPYRGWHVGCLAVVLWYIDYRKSQQYEG